MCRTLKIHTLKSDNDKGSQLADQEFKYQLCKLSEKVLEPLRSFWGDLPLDPYLEEGYRTRRLSRFRVNDQKLVHLPVECVVQTAENNRRWGGLPRTFDSLEDALKDHPSFQEIAAIFLDAIPIESEGLILWVHQIRMECDGSKGVPVPEGIHRDERMYVGIAVTDIQGLSCGETKLFHHPEEEPFYKKTLEVGEMIVIHDEAMYHYTEPFYDVTGSPGHRDIFIFAVTNDDSTGVAY